MRFLFTTTIGSTMNFFKSLIKELIEKGNTVDIATNEKISCVPSFYKDLGCKVFNISWSRSIFNKGNLKAIKQLKSIVGNYDIVHCHTPIAGAITRIACRRIKKEKKMLVIYTAHGFHFYKGCPLTNWLLYYPIEKKCSKWTDVLITINREDYELAKKKMKAKRVEYVSGVGINVSRFKNITFNKSLKKAELKIPVDSKVLLSVGELNKNKNHEAIIKALHLIKNTNIHFVIAGEGPLKSKLQTLANSLGVNLHLLGYRDDIPELYHCADICVFTSIREGLGLAAIEGMASGLPLICSINRGTKEYISNGAIACAYNDYKGFARAIVDLCTDKERCHKMGETNIAISQRFDVEVVNKKMNDIYMSSFDAYVEK